MAYSVTIRDIQELGPDLKQFRVDRPANYNFVPGQATQVTIDDPDWSEVTRPFSFTSLRADTNLEFIIKIHPERDELTRELDKLKVSDQLLIQEPEPAVQYTGAGVFLAQGVGILSFVGILRQLREDDELEGNRLMLFNEKVEDIILGEEFESMLGSAFLNVLSEETESEKYITGTYDRDFLEEHIDNLNRKFYVCGSPEFVETVQKYLQGADIQPETLAYEE